MKAIHLKHIAIIALASNSVLAPSAYAQGVHGLIRQSAGHIAKAQAQALPVDFIARGSSMQLSIVLPLRNTDALEGLLKDLYDPSSPSYGHYLKPSQFAAQFGPTQADYDAVANYMVKHGLKVARTSPNRVVLDVEGPVEAVQNTFHVNEVIFQRQDFSSFYAPDRMPTVSDDLKVPILCVGGLDNANPPHRVVHYQMHANDITGVKGFWSPLDLRKAYNVPSSLTGAGQTLGDWPGNGVTASDITTFEDQYGLRHVPVQYVSVDGTQPSSGNGEDTLDVEQAVGAAPGAKAIVLYLGGSPVAKLNRMATDNIAQTFSNSYGYDVGTIAGENQVYQQMAAQGQSNFVATGDYGAWDKNIQNPQDQPYITGVGGSQLFSSSNGAWQTDLSWGGSGGGISPSWPIPWYQQGLSMTANHGSTTMRNGPDISVNAGSPGISTYTGWSGWDGGGGTSYSSPFWSGLTALINEQRAKNGLGPIGFLNPTLYAIGKGPHYHSDFHDIADGGNNNNGNGQSYPSVAGYDLINGWGTPIANNLIADLSGGYGNKVNLASVANVYGIYTNGTTFTNATSLDNNGYSYSSALLGQGFVWNGTEFTIGAPNVPDAVTNKTIPLPAGKYTAIRMLATAIYAAQPNQTFKVTYTDGTSSTFTQSLSLWTASSAYAGESIVQGNMAYRLFSNGTQSTATHPNIYGYSFAVTSTKTVSSITLPSNRKVVALAISLVPVNAPVSVSLASAFNAYGLYNDGATFTTGGLDGNGYAYSGTVLAPWQNWNNIPFTLGAANTKDAISCTGQTITLTAGNYSKIALLAGAMNGSQAAQALKVTYTDNTTATFTQSFSDWVTSSAFANEAAALPTGYRNGSGGTKDTTYPVTMYGYSFNLTTAKAVKSITLPNNSNVKLFAMTLVP